MSTGWCAACKELGCAYGTIGRLTCQPCAAAPDRPQVQSSLPPPPLPLPPPQSNLYHWPTSTVQHALWGCQLAQHPQTCWLKQGVQGEATSTVRDCRWHDFQTIYICKTARTLETSHSEHVTTEPQISQHKGTAMKHFTITHHSHSHSQEKVRHNLQCLWRPEPTIHRSLTVLGMLPLDAHLLAVQDHHRRRVTTDWAAKQLLIWHLQAFQEVVQHHPTGRAYGRLHCKGGLTFNPQ